MTATTLPAYMILEGDVATLPGIGRPKKVYRVEDAGVRYVEQDGTVQHVPQITFHVNAPERTGLAGTVTVDYETEVEVHGKAAQR